MILTTGVLSGLGKAAYERFGGMGLTRADSAETMGRAAQKEVDAIIHCAASPPSAFTGDSNRLSQDTMELTTKLVGLKHKKFVFLSTADVYPVLGPAHAENDALPADASRGAYAASKLAAEVIVRSRCPNHLILRASAMLGPYARKNSLTRIIEDEPCRLTLSADSSFNYVLHLDVLDFIERALARDLRGTYNVASRDNATLAQLAKLAGRDVYFGAHRYETPQLDNRRAAVVLPAFLRTTLETAAAFMATAPKQRSKA